MKWRCKHIGLLLCVLVCELTLSNHRSEKPVRAFSSNLLASGTPAAALEEADRLSWVDNWYMAEPLYSSAEAWFHKIHDHHNELHARLGRIRSQASYLPLDHTFAEFTRELNQPEVRHDAKLRMWALALLASMRIDSDTLKAKREWEASLDIAEKFGQSEWAARARGELGVIAFLEGNTASAVSLLGSSILSAYRSGDRGSQVRLLSMLGLGFNEERRFSEALIIFEKAIAIAEQTPGAGFPFLAYAGEAASLLGLNQRAQAQELLNKALSIARSQHDRMHEADLVAQSGQVAVTKQRLLEAETAFQEAGRIAQQLNDYRTVSEVMFELADVERQRGKLRAADMALSFGVKASRHLGDRYYLPRDLSALAELKMVEGKLREADKLYTQAEDVLDEILINQHSFEENTARAGSMSRLYLEHFKLARRIGNADRAFQIIERVRARVVASKLLVRDLMGAPSSKVTGLQRAISATQLELLRTDDLSKKTSLMSQLLAQERNLAFELNEAGLRQREILVKPVPLRALQKVLMPDELFAEYVLDEPEALCILASRSSIRMLKLPVGSSSIRALTHSYISEVRARRSSNPFADELYRVLLSPITSSFTESRLIISTDDVLNALPFESLRDDHDYLVRSKVITYTPSGTVLWLLRKKNFHEGARPLLAVGAVDYKFARAIPERFAQSASTAIILRGLAEITGAQLTDLPGSRDEVSAISQIVGQDSQVLLSENATESNFKMQPLEEFRVIHLATHATADKHYPDRSALVLGATPQTSDDGLLQVREIMDLRLNADLVTLSACDTSLGTDEKEAGVINLEEAFLIAGARVVVASLWNVEDSSTTALMKAFYRHLSEHEDKALALVHAKRDMLDRYGNESPYYWAGFVMAGDGAERVPLGN